MNNFNYLFDTRLPRPGVIIISDELAVRAGTSDRDGRMSCRLARQPAGVGCPEGPVRTEREVHS